MLIKIFLSTLSIFFSLLMVYVTVINFKKKTLNKVEFLMWNLFWLGVIFLSIRPKFIDDYFLKTYNTDLFYILAILGIIFLMILSYFNMLKIKIIEQKINTIIRAEALKKIINKINK